MTDKKKVSLLEFENNPNIGLYMFTNDKFCLIGQELDEQKQKEIENVLKVPVYHVNILSTNLVGVFVAGNNEILLTPQLNKDEFEKLEEITKKHNTKLITLTNKLNTIGNNICVGDEEIIISDEYSEKFISNLKKETTLNVFTLSHKEYQSTGAICKFQNGKYFISQELEESDVKEFLDKIAGVGTINAGSNFIASGVIGNKFGLLLGSMSTTVEIQNIVEDLDYL